MQRRHLPGLAALALMLTVAACSSGSDADDEDAGSTTTTEVAEEETTTTSEAVEEESGTPTGQVHPLTGLPDDGGPTRPALAVKIDNHRSSRPQVGLDQADIVFEARAEGVTRFMAVFHSEAPDPIGPVRSSRTSDFDLLRGLNTPLYASSGGNDFVAATLRNLPIHEVTAISQRVYVRDPSRPAPHNLFVDTADLFALAPEGAEEPFPWFEYRDDAEPLPASAVELDGPVTISFRGSPLVTYTWDAERSGWLRTQDNRPHATVAGEQLAPANVVIMMTSYVTSPADASSPELVSVGEGTAYVLSDGAVIEGTWTREDASSAPTLLDVDGQTIKLTPGQTWVLYPEEGQVTLSE